MKNTALVIIIGHLLILFGISYLDTHVLFKKKSITVSFQERIFSDVAKTSSKKNLSYAEPSPAPTKPSVTKKTITKKVEDKPIKKQKKDLVTVDKQKKSKQIVSEKLDKLLASLDTKKENKKNINNKKVTTPLFPSFMAAIEKNEDADGVDTPFGFAMSYQELLVAELKNNLNLPDFGEVKATITINPEGKIVKINIVHAKSKKNEEYLKNRLPQLTFSWFNQYAKEKTITLTIIFKNEI
jgi:hypothetical protein